MSFIIATVPHTGTTALAAHLGVTRLLYQWDTPLPRYGHVFPEHLSRLIKAPCEIITTWRDPLLTAMSWQVRYVFRRTTNRTLGTQDVTVFFRALLALIEARPVTIRSLDGIPAKNVNPRRRRFSEFYELHARRDIETIERKMPEQLKRLRQLPWGDFKTEEWWR